MIYFFNSSRKSDKLSHPVTICSNSERRALAIAVVKFLEWGYKRKSCKYKIMIAIKEFNTVFIKVDNNNTDFDDCLKLVFKGDMYVSAKDFFFVMYGTEIASANLKLGDTTHLILQFDDSIGIDDLYKINPNGNLSVRCESENNNYNELLTFIFAI